MYHHREQHNQSNRYKQKENISQITEKRAKEVLKLGHQRPSQKKHQTRTNQLRLTVVQ